jgi:hypothetical protein
MEAWGVTLKVVSGSPGQHVLYEVHGHWDAALQRTMLITLLGLQAVRESLLEFARTVRDRWGKPCGFPQTIS